MPELSVLLAVHDDDRFVASAIESILRQTFGDFELLVVDDASTDGTPRALDEFTDGRLRVLRNDEQLGLASSLNRALGKASGTYVARMDADDVALPMRFQRQLAAMRAGATGVLGTAIRDLDEEGHEGRLHRMPTGALAVRWHALFNSPFFHPTVVVNREALGDLCYDTSFLESEDYDLWTRLLGRGTEGGNLAEPLLLKRVHERQASLRRSDVQRSFQRRVALREIERLAPDVDADAAWQFGIGLTRSREAVAAYRELLARFTREYGADPEVRATAARRLARARRVVSVARVARPRARRPLHGPTRVTVVSPEPTPYRAPLFDRIARREDIELTVIYAARTVASRTWSVEHDHHSVFLRGAAVPGLRSVLRHDYPLTPGIFAVLQASRPAVVVVSGWSTFASQAAIAWCRARRIPYVLLVESHDLEPRAAWRRAVKGAVVPTLVRHAANILAVGSAARDSVIARGAAPTDVRIFANTIDVDAWIARAEHIVRASRDGVLVLSVGRRVSEKGFDVLEAACAQAGVEVEIVAGGLEENELAGRYAKADIFALLSRHEPWGVVVNEAAASALPLVLSDRVGAACDLLRDRENGFLVPADDVDAAAEALRRLAANPDLRRRFGERSRELVRAWGYEPSVESFVTAVREATTSR